MCQALHSCRISDRWLVVAGLWVHERERAFVRVFRRVRRRRRRGRGHLVSSSPSGYRWWAAGVAAAVVCRPVRCTRRLCWLLAAGWRACERVVHHLRRWFPAPRRVVTRRRCSVFSSGMYVGRGDGTRPPRAIS